MFQKINLKLHLKKNDEGKTMSDSWKILESEELVKLGYFKVTADKCELPDGRIMPRYYVIHFSDWVHVLPITKDGKVVFVDQYRHAAEGRFLELPGGTTEPGINEEPKVAGIRELREETGYDSQEIIDLGYHYPNPALQSNKVHSYLALNCELKFDQDLDPYEDINVKLIDVKEAYRMHDAGEIKHSLMNYTFTVAKKHLSQFL